MDSIRLEATGLQNISRESNVAEENLPHGADSQQTGETVDFVAASTINLISCLRAKRARRC
jgi:hypothetical protein